MSDYLIDRTAKQSLTHKIFVGLTIEIKNLTKNKCGGGLGINTATNENKVARALAQRARANNIGGSAMQENGEATACVLYYSEP